MPAESRLLTVQRRFMAAVQEPIFDESRALSQLPSQSGAVSESFVRTANTLITPSRSLHPVERLELYHRQYWYRLLDSIADDFPALSAMLKDAVFWRLIEAYLEATPPLSYTLRHLGAGLADFVAANPALVPSPVHAVELARLEYALMEAFEAGEAEPVAPESLESAAIALQPHIKLLALRTRADTLWRRVEREAPIGSLAEPTPAPSRFVVVFRQAFSLRVERLSRAAFVLLSGIDETHSLTEAVKNAMSTPGLLRARDTERLRRWFETWVAREWFRHADAPTPAPGVREGRGH